MAEQIAVYRADDGAWREVGPRGFDNATGGYPPGWVEAVSHIERAAAQAALVDVPDAPPGKVVTGRSIGDGEAGPVVTLIVRDLDDAELSALRAARAAEVKAEAERRILAIMAEYEQRNALALGLELTTTHGPDPSAWPAEDQATYAAVMAKWAQIKAIRAASDTIEAALPEDAAGLAALDVAGAAAWPA